MIKDGSASCTLAKAILVLACMLKLMGNDVLHLDFLITPTEEASLDEGLSLGVAGFD